jgi:hypothetical protein
MAIFKISKTMPILFILVFLSLAVFSMIPLDFLKDSSKTNAENLSVSTATNSHKPSLTFEKRQNHLIPTNIIKTPASVPLNAQAWLENFLKTYRLSVKAAMAMLAAINSETPADFFEQLLVLVQFMPVGDPARDALEGHLIDRLARLNPTSAADFVLEALRQLPEYALLLPESYRLLEQLMRTWGEINPTAAVNWAFSLEDEETKGQALIMLSYSKDPHLIDMVAEEANRLPKSDIRKGLLIRLAQQKAQSDPNQTAEWVTSWPDSPERYRAVEALIDSWPSQSLTDTGDFVEDLLANGMTPDPDATDRLFVRWYNQNPDEAIHWASNLPESAVRSRAFDLLREIRQNALAEQ